MFRSNRLKIFLVGAGFFILVLVALIVSGLVSPFQDEGPTGDVVLWTFPQYEEVIRAFADGYQLQFPGFSIAVEAHPEESFELELLNALATGRGPDAFVVDVGDLVRFAEKMYPLPSSAAFVEAFVEEAADAAVDDLMNSSGELLGVPLFFDTLALYYNRDHANAANFPLPPVTWDEFRAQSIALTQRSPTGAVVRSGAAMGTARNVLHAPDIFSLLVLQGGNPIVNRTASSVVLTKKLPTNRVESPAESALVFYTSFAKPGDPAYAWNPSLPVSREAFASERTSFYIGYGRDLQPIVRANPHLNFRVAEVPQLVKGERISLASYPVVVVSRLSKDPTAAWAFASALFSKDAQKFISDNLGLASARRDLVADKPQNAILQPFYNQVLSARSWLVPDNAKTDQIFSEMIESVARGQATAGVAMSRAEMQLSLLFGRGR